MSKRKADSDTLEDGGSAFKVPKKVAFNLPEDTDGGGGDSGGNGLIDSEAGPSDEKIIKKHSLDSDEEDYDEETDKYNVLNPEELFGEEAGMARQEGDVKITPFNMNEELQEGHFDKEGTFIYNKVEEIRDYFVDNIDKVELAVVKPNKQSVDSAGSDSEDEPPSIDVQKCFTEMLNFMNPNETVTRAIQRLGKSSKKPIGKRNARREEEKTEAEKLKIAKDKEDLNKLIALADQVLQTGDMDVYEKTYEQIKFYLSTFENNVNGTTEPEDMFAD